MLDTRERTLLPELLRPPVGYSIDRAIGTSYTLDLTTLLIAPLALTFFNYHDEDGELTKDPVALLVALRRHAERITLFCQAGSISVPKPNQLFAYLERSVVEVTAPKRGGVFHPKVWLLRFVAEGRPTRYRFLCLSRNLTFARAWDTCLALEGELTARTLGFSQNRPLSDFISQLPRLAIRDVPTGCREVVEQMASEVRRVRFETPAPFQDHAFHPMGLGRRSTWPFPTGARLMVMAPYLTEWALRKCREENELEFLISRPEALAPITRELLPKSGTYVLSPAADMDSQESPDEELPRMTQDTDESHEPVELTGLHAKLYVAQKGHHAHVFTGSTNATTAGLQRNVEFLVELVGGWKRCGIQGILGSPRDENQSALFSLLQRYRPRDDAEPIDEIQEELNRDVERLVRELAGRKLTAHATVRQDKATYDLALEGRPPPNLEGTRIWVWPVTLSGEQRLSVRMAGQTLVRFERLSVESLTAFWAFEIEMRREGKEARRRFAVVTSLEGAPEDRRQRLMNSFLKDRKRVLRLLLLLLADEGLDVSRMMAAVDDASSNNRPWSSGWDDPTLLETLLYSLSENPKRLNQAEQLIRDLRKTPEGAELLPPDLDVIWVPIWEARRRLR